MKELIINIIVGIWVVVAILFVSCEMFIIYQNKNNETYNSFLEKEIVIRNDTLMITDFDYINGNYHLSNGAVIDKTLVFKHFKNDGENN